MMYKKLLQVIESFPQRYTYVPIISYWLVFPLQTLCNSNTAIKIPLGWTTTWNISTIYFDKMVLFYNHKRLTYSFHMFMCRQPMIFFQKSKYTHVNHFYHRFHSRLLQSDTCSFTFTKILSTFYNVQIYLT